MTGKPCALERGNKRMNMNYSNVMGSTTAMGLSMQQRQPVAAQAQAPAMPIRELDDQMGFLNAATEELGRTIGDLADRLAPLLRQLPVGEGGSSCDDACTSQLGSYMADKVGAMRHMTRRVQDLIDRLAI